MMIGQSFEENEDSNSVYAMYDVLKELCLNNVEYFKSDESTIGKKFCESFKALHNNVVSIYPIVDEIRKVAPYYDFNQNTQGNGYRSFVTVVDAFILYGEKTCQQICKNRNSYFFRKGTYLREVETCSQALSSLCVILTHLKTLISWSDPGCLFPKDERSPQELLTDSPGFNQICFYGTCLGFQFCESMQAILKGLSILMVSFSEVYYSEGGMLERATNYLWHSSKYVLNPELRARRIVNISQYSSVDFCKQFWFLGENELMNRLPNFVHPSVEVNRMISIPPEPLSSPRADGFLVDIPIPSSHSGPSPLSVRLLSAVKRQHMVGEAGGKESLVPPSKGLIFHCHGGGFVAQSSRSHEAYLRQWAQGLPAPILSVDYSLAPEAPFPRALEEALYAYCWALNNTTLLGTTAERIVFAGDSAGANLVIGVAMKCIELGLRPPDGLFLAYVPVVVSFVPSPGRLLCLMDPLLPFGFLMGCLKAYACPPDVYAASLAHENKLRRCKKSKSDTLTKSNSSSEESFEELSASELLELDKILEKEGVNAHSAPELELPQDAVSPGLPHTASHALQATLPPPLPALSHLSHPAPALPVWTSMRVAWKMTRYWRT
ncbi:hormone-sensitive lipase-like [Homalodisca vitripennis]|uniref:hormone-sensitive lipase-like n=1 Tax=Homalodisca vitripennis TaxID=197043 RepID=UPI001EE9FB22|nr:hormone-sensitive lipase-like [Homalodisca vitripennis]